MATQNANTSAAATVTTVETKVEDSAPTLKLRPPNSEKKQLKWSEDTIDNEGQGKKSSKCCCVYRKPLQFGESSDEDSDTDSDDEKCKGPKDYHKNTKKHKHDDENCNSCH